MRKIFKYDLPVVDKQDVLLPPGATPLYVGHQGEADKLYLWAWVDPELEPTQPLTVYIFGTGHKIPELPRGIAYKHLGTVPVGPFVWHVFTEREDPRESK